MKKVKVYVRTDLRTKEGKKVPNGKMASQSAHGVMALFLGLFDRDGRTLTLRKQNLELFKAFKESEIVFEYLPVKSSEEFEKIANENVGKSVVIQDQGRTAFSEPTNTVIAVAYSDVSLSTFLSCKSEEDKLASKQVMVINKDEIKDKWEMFSVVSEASLNFLINLVELEGFDYVLRIKKESLDNWINGAFAKITLKPKEFNFKTARMLLEKASENNIYTGFSKINGVVKCVAFGADKKENIDNYTSKGFNLA